MFRIKWDLHWATPYSVRFWDTLLPLHLLDIFLYEMCSQWLFQLQINNSVSCWQNWVKNDSFQASSEWLMSWECISKFIADTNWDSALEAGSVEHHMHHLADRKPLRPNRLAIDKLLLNFSQGTVWWKMRSGREEGRRKGSIIYPNSIETDSCLQGRDVKDGIW